MYFIAQNIFHCKICKKEALYKYKIMNWFTNKILFNSVIGLSLFYFSQKWLMWMITKPNNKQIEFLPKSTKKTIFDEENEYKESMLRRFLASYDEIDSTEKYNTNIDSIFYLRALYQEAMKDPENELEKTWKRRILMESTPRGNVIMYYDAFKRSFSYYSDTSMPYSLLNAVCMKYVLIYRCRDFFVDQYVIPAKFPTVLHKIHDVDDTIDPDKEKKKNELKQIMSNGPFLKSKNSTNAKSNNIVIESIPDLIKNKIIRVDRLSNFHPLIKEKSIPKQNPKQIDTEFVLVKSYSDFKQWRTPNINMFN